MQFYDATNKRAICQEIDRLCDSDDTTYPRLDKTARVNTALDELVGKIIRADGTWEWDDTNQSDLPRGKGTLVEGQQQYSFASDYLDIRQIDILTTTPGLWQTIKPLNPDELDGFSPEEYFGVDASGNPKKGMPLYYDKEGDSIRLFPAPSSTNVTLTNGLRVWFQRTAVFFTPVATTAADTTEPGIPSPYHSLLCYMAALPYCMTYKKDRIALYKTTIDQMTKDLIAFYGHREKDKRKIMTMGTINYI